MQVWVWSQQYHLHHLNKQDTAHRQYCCCCFFTLLLLLCSWWMHSVGNLNFFLNVLTTDDQKEIFMNTTQENILSKTVWCNIIRLLDQSPNGPCSRSPSSTSSPQNELDFLADWKPFALQLAHIKIFIASFNTSNLSGREPMAVEYLRECALV